MLIEGPLLRELHGLLLSLFGSSDELRVYIRQYQPDGAKLLAELPGPAASFAALVDAYGELLQRHGLIDHEFFATLERAFPRRRRDIRSLTHRLFGAKATPVQDSAGPELARLAPALVKPGAGLRLSREAGDAESALRVNEYAAILAELFATAGGNFSFGLFGPWGRGKTFLMRQLARRLERDHGYVIVQFSAWAYPQTPILWAHLYECFADRALKGSWRARTGRTLRTALFRHGAGGLFGALGLFGLGAVPLGLWTQLALAMYALFGLAGLFMLLRVARRGSAFARGVRAYFAVRRHDDALGLQAVIGKDLAALLCGWIPDGAPVTRGSIALFIALVLASTAALYPWQAAVGSATWWLGCALAAAWLGVNFTFAVLALRRGDAPRQLLLVVDDLDRCEPDQMLAIIENLRLFIETQGVGERMQVAMLVDDGMLEQALRAKYRPSWQPSTSDEFLLEESVEKLFLVYLRLPPLTEADIDELARNYFTAMRAAAASPSSNHPVRRAHEPAAAAADLATNRGDEHVSRDLTFTEAEESVLAEELRMLAASRHGRFGPRTVRSFLFRYQLARLLLRALGESVEASELARCLAQANGSALAETEGSPVTRRVVGQVSLR